MHVAIDIETATRIMITPVPVPEALSKILVVEK